MSNPVLQYSSPPPKQKKRPRRRRWSLRPIVWALVAVAVIATFASLMGDAMVRLFASGLLALIVFVAIVAAAWELNRAQRSMIVLAYVEQAVRLNLPLPMMLAAAAQSERGPTARVLERLQARLEDGDTLQHSAVVTLRGLPSRQIGLIGSAERSGRLPQSLHRMIEAQSPRRTQRFGPALYLRWYPLTLAAVMLAVVGLMSIFVLPKLEEIFHDFKLELPPQTVALFALWDTLSLPLAVAGGVVMFVYLILTLVSFLPASMSGQPFLSITDWFKWHIPGPAGVTRRRAMADVCNVLADAIEVGRPLDWALAEASRCGTNHVLAERIAVWADYTRSGMPVTEGAARAGMPPVFVGMLRTAGGAAMPELLRFLAKYYESQFARSRIVIESLLVPGVAIIMGSGVAWVVFSLFAPLLRLVDALSITSGGFR